MCIQVHHSWPFLRVFSKRAECTVVFQHRNYRTNSWSDRWRCHSLPKVRRCVSWWQAILPDIPQPDESCWYWGGNKSARKFRSFSRRLHRYFYATTELGYHFVVNWRGQNSFCSNKKWWATWTRHNCARAVCDAVYKHGREKNDSSNELQLASSKQSLQLLQVGRRWKSRPVQDKERVKPGNKKGRKEYKRKTAEWSDRDAAHLQVTVRQLNQSELARTSWNINNASPLSPISHQNSRLQTVDRLSPWRKNLQYIQTNLHVHGNIELPVVSKGISSLRYRGNRRLCIRRPRVRFPCKTVSHCV